VARDADGLRRRQGRGEDSGEDAFTMQFRVNENGAPDESDEPVNRIAQYEEN
jgi:hypothetical protein